MKSSGTGGRRVSSKNCNFSKNCEKLEKSQFLLKLITTGVRGGTRVPCKNCDFCNLSKTCKKLQKSQFLLKLLNSSGKGGTRVSSKNCDFCNFWDFSKKLLKIRNNCNDPWQAICLFCYRPSTKVDRFLSMRYQGNTCYCMIQPCILYSLLANPD